jgi:thiosulfate sulfurtransferase
MSALNFEPARHRAARGGQRQARLIERHQQGALMNIPQIQIHEAKNKLDRKNCLFVDIRDPASYQAAHIPGAVHLHDGNVQDFVQNTAKDADVVVYCYHGNSSLGAAAFFMENGFESVASMSGGFEAWRQVYEH